jgi:hypothetical protein
VKIIGDEAWANGLGNERTNEELNLKFPIRRPLGLAEFSVVINALRWYQYFSGFET